MSRKRTSQESSTDEQTNADSDSCQQDDNAKHAKFDSLNETMLQDLPPELIQCILINAIIMEVKGMRLVKSMWKEKAEVVINRLGSVCWQWSDILSTNFFRQKLHIGLDSTAQEKIRLEILHQSPLQSDTWRIATMKDEVFILCTLPLPDQFIRVYDRRNMAVVKDVIPLPKKNPQCMEACSVSNCLYVLNREATHNHFSILRISIGDDENRFTVSQFLGGLLLPQADLCVSANGSVVISRQQTETIDAISVHDASGSLQCTIRLPSEVSGFYRIIPKINGNLVLIQQLIYMQQPKLTEIAMNGVIVRQCRSSLSRGAITLASNADHNGCIFIFDQAGKMELLDSEFNRIQISNPQPIAGHFISPHELRYNVDRDEMVATATDQDTLNRLLYVFHLA